MSTSIAVKPPMFLPQKFSSRCSIAIVIITFLSACGGSGAGRGATAVAAA
jgi:hypothetical protein